MENQQDSQVAKTESSQVEADANSTISEDVKTENMIPQSRFNEVNDKMKTYASELEKFKKAEEDAKVKKMEEQGRYDEIIATKDSEINRLVKIEEKYNKWDSNKREKYLNMLPDEQKAKFQHLNTDDLENIAETFIKDESMAQVDSTRASARVNVVKPFSAKAKDKAEQKKSWADKIKSYR